MYTLIEIKEILGDDYRFHQQKTVEEMKEILEMGERPTDDVPVILEVTGYWNNSLWKWYGK